MLMEKVRARLEALSRLVPRLHKAADAYMAELKRIERILKRLNVATAIELEGLIQRSNSTSRYNDDGKRRGVFHYAWALAYGEDHRGQWCLLIRKYEVDETSKIWSETEVTPLLQAPGDLRLAAADRIPELVKAIEEAVEKKRSGARPIQRLRR
jgi:hypothetical protein